MAELNVRLDLSFGARSMRCLMVGAMLLSAATEVASESLTLTTYYPAPSGVYSQMITTGNTFLARDTGFVDVGTTANLAAGVKMAVMGGYVGIGTTSPGFPLHVSDPAGGGWVSVFQNTTAGGAISYFSHGGGYGGYIDAGTNASAGTYALDVNRAGSPYLYVRGDGNVGIGNGGPTQKLDVTGAVNANAFLPGSSYTSWATYGTGAGGAAIYNDGAGYGALMIVGNNSQGHERIVKVWDSFLVNGQITTTDGSCVEVSYNINGVTTCAAAGFGGPSYATVQSGLISYMTVMPYYTNPVGQQQGGLAPMLCCSCPASGCPL